jgi:hypothetical protein
MIQEMMKREKGKDIINEMQNGQSGHEKYYNGYHRRNIT